MPPCSVIPADCRVLQKKMKESSESKVYEISYLLVPSLPEEKVGEQAAAFSALLAKHSASVIDEEAPSLISLAYEMDKSQGGGSHQRFDKGYFGWIKFSCLSSSIEEIRKAFEQNPNALRVLAVATLKEKTYLGKRAKSEAKPDSKGEEKQASTAPADAAGAASESAAPAALSMTPTEIAAVDKSIDEMVKGA